MLRYCVNISLALCLMCCFITHEVKAQDPQFSQFFATRIYMNPAFAGNTHFNRFSSHVRRQWAAIQGYTSNGFYFDQNLPWFNSGIGVSMFQDRQSAGGLVFNKFSGYYSYRFSLSRKLFARLGVSTSYSIFNVNLSEFVFTDQLLSGSSSTTDGYRFDRLSYFDYSSGGVVYSKSFWAGLSVSNLNNFSRRFDNPFPVKLSVHGGVLIPINKDIKGEFLKDLTIAGQYKTQQDYDQFDIGAYYGYSMVLIGVWYRGMLWLKDNESTITNQDAVILVGGIKYEAYRFTYSYDISASSLHTHSAGSHEISLQIDLWRNKVFKRKPNSKLNVPCPNFGGPGWQIEKK